MHHHSTFSVIKELLVQATYTCLRIAKDDFEYLEVQYLKHTASCMALQSIALW